MALCLTAVITRSLAGAHATGLPQHLTSAQMRITPGGSLESPPVQLAMPPDAGPWQQTSLPLVVPRQITPDTLDNGAVKTVWVRVPVPDAARTGQADDRLYLYASRWQTVGRLAVYVDGQLRWHSRAGPVWNSYNYPLWIPLGPDPHEIVVRMDMAGQVGGALSTMRIDTNGQLLWRYALRSFLQTQFPYLSSGALLAIGIFSLMIWCRRRAESRYLLCFLAAGSYFLHTLQYLVGQDPLPFPEAWFTWLAFNSIAWLILTCYVFIFRYLDVRYRRLEAGLICVVVFLATSTLPLSWFTHAVFLFPLAQLLLVCLNLTASIAALQASWRARSREALLFSIWNAMSTPIAVHDVLLQNYRISIEGIYLLSYLGCVQLLLFMYLMYHRYIGALEQVAQVNASLAMRLAQREAELNESHRQLRDIERRETLAQERQRLLEDMHDGLGSSLMSALRVVEQRSAEIDVAQLLRECIDDLKLTIDSLEPDSADLLLLLATLRYRLGPRLEAAGIRLVWEVEDVPPLQWLDPQGALHVLRIVQEVFTNILKHANATVIRVQTRVADATVRVSIHDNGAPFEPDTTSPARGGRGLTNLHRRAQAIGATIGWQADANGTWFALNLAVARATTDA
ncbi:histidine kinase [Cupriavidus pauculus]|uniref:histidine kinase n=2 Tax=Cupriavidus pauculus TaxID=82633 RepID=A0A2N5CF51_9BURK|nr:histidine kinase [Cupriavidus pauculus]